MASRKLGRRPPSNAPRLKIKLTGITPDHPQTVDHFSKITDWGLWGNDQFGDCGPVSVGNLVKLTTGYLTGQEVSVTQDDVFDLYKRSGNPNFPNEDNGVVMQDMLDALLKGGLAGRKPIAFGQVDVKGVEDLRAAVAVFGGVLLGVTLDTAQDEQTNKGLWDYVKSYAWGGHAVLCGRYADTSPDSSDRTGVVTWAEVVDMTDTFITHQVDEVWVVVWPEHLKDEAFLQGVDIEKMAADFKALTGKTLPTPAPPTPPGPANEVMDFLAALYAWLKGWFRG